MIILINCFCIQFSHFRVFQNIFTLFYLSQQDLFQTYFAVIKHNDYDSKNIIIKVNCLIIVNKLLLKQKRLMTTISLLILLFVTSLTPVHSQITPKQTVYFSSCDQSTDATRKCANSVNQTDFLLALKKGGSNILSTSSYTTNYFLCEEYTFDCGYIETDKQFISVGNGIELNMSLTQFNALPIATTATKDKIRPYIGYSGFRAACGISMVPLTLTPSQVNQFFTAYMTNLTSYAQTQYMASKALASQNWADININIKTAVLQSLKESWAKIETGNILWQSFLTNDYRKMSDTLKDEYRVSNEKEKLHTAYLIDSVISTCQKYQSINFLVDESGSVTLAGFTLALDFLRQYVTNTKDDIPLMSIHFYQSVFLPYVDYGKNRSQVLNMINTKTYNAGGTNTGSAINATVAKIIAANYPNGLPKILAVLTDGISNDPVLASSNYARSKGITLLSVGIGSNVNVAQLIEIAGDPTNYIQISSYADIPKLADFISNYFCKTITTIQIGDSFVGNKVRVETSPNYYRIPKNTGGAYYELFIYYETNPDLHNQSAEESQVDPFPDEFTEYTMSENYRANQTTKVYFIEPANLESLKIKKNYTRDDTMITSYLAIRGTNLSYNLTLTACATIPCTQQREKFKNSTNPVPNPTPTPGGGDIPYNPPQEDLSIFIYIAIAVLIMLACSILLIFLIRKRTTQDQEQREALKHSENQSMMQQEIKSKESENNDQDKMQKSNHSKSSKSKSNKRKNSNHSSSNSSKNDKSKSNSSRGTN